LRPSPRLIAHLVTIKNATEPESFMAAARSKLDAAGIGGRAEIPPTPCGPRQGQPRRRMLRVDGYNVVGFALTVDGLTAAESIRLQTARVFGRAHMGGGFFLPHQEDNHGKV
jgi:CRISPR-associated protein Cas6